MCCFSHAIRSVSQTNIFARSGPNGRQYLVYSMRLDTPSDVAMILPIPVASGADEKAVRFIDLEGYPGFFEDMLKLFVTRTKGPGGEFAGSLSASARLEVHHVGSFEASYVPTIRDFNRLDPRFQLPAGTWNSLPLYKSYGFAVFKLKPGAQVVHPMAFDFPRANLRRLFFPTVHIHDGKVHATAGFDHALFCQRYMDDRFSLAQWRESDQLADAEIKNGYTKSIVIPKAHVYMRALRGRQKNQDTWAG